MFGMSAINQAVELLGLVGVGNLYLPPISPQAVHKWTRGATIPAERCPAIERATAGQVRCEDLRPDVDWAVLRCQCTETPPANHEQEAA